MDPQSFNGALFRTWEPRIAAAPPGPLAAPPPPRAELAAPRALEFGFGSIGPVMNVVRRESARTLDDLFRDYGVRLSTLSKMTELGFTVQTLVNMTDQEVDDVIKTLLESYHVELLVGEKYGIKAAIRAERKHLEDELERHRAKAPAKVDKRRRPDEANAGLVRRENVNNGSLVAVPEALNMMNTATAAAAAAAVQALPSSPTPDSGNGSDSERKRHTKKKQKRKRLKDEGEDGEDRPREHPFIVTEPGELARGKKNGLDYLFDLYEQCGRYLEEVQQQCKERGEKCPTKVTNQVFRHAKHRGASYINKPKMRHYVHCYALHCLDLEQSNHLRKLFKDRGENVGAWRQACYYPLVEMARAFNWDIEGVFSRNERLRIWYVPTKLRQLCHIEKSKE